MPDYAEMYKKLFRSQTRAIEMLQQAQQEVEEMYVSANDLELSVILPEADNELSYEKNDGHN